MTNMAEHRYIMHCFDVTYSIGILRKEGYTAEFWCLAFMNTPKHRRVH